MWTQHCIYISKRDLLPLDEMLIYSSKSSQIITISYSYPGDMHSPLKKEFAIRPQGNIVDPLLRLRGLQSERS